MALFGGVKNSYHTTWSSLAELITRTETTADRVLLTEIGRQLSTPDLLDKRQAADFLGSGVRTVDDWRQQKKIPFIKCGGFVRFRREDLEAFLESHTVESRKASAYRPRVRKTKAVLSAAPRTPSSAVPVGTSGHAPVIIGTGGGATPSPAHHHGDHPRHHHDHPPDGPALLANEKGGNK